MSNAQHLLRKHLRMSSIAVLALVGTSVAATTISPISGAVLAPGSVVVENSLRRVQHPTGGVVGKLHVTDGQRVQQNDVVVRLDDTLTRANLAIIVNELHGLMARRSRLQAERDTSPDMTLPPELKRRADAEPEIGAMVLGEHRLMMARRATRQGQKSQLRERIEQFKEEARGAVIQLESMVGQKKLANSELSDLMDLLRKNLVQRPRVTQLQREVMRLEGTIGETTSRRAQINGRISEIELQILQIDTDHVSEIAKELREVETKVAELSERRIAAEDQLSKIEVRAPISGQVHQLAVHTVGGVVSAGETMMMIVPDAEQLIVEARVSPNDIDEVRQQQDARVRFSSFNQSTTPELLGRVIRISGDLSKDQQTGATYYTIAILIPDTELNRLVGLRLLPGMPAETMLKTTDRTIASFLIKPLLDHMNRSFRET